MILSVGNTEEKYFLILDNGSIEGKMSPLIVVDRTTEVKMSHFFNLVGWNAEGKKSLSF